MGPDDVFTERLSDYLDGELDAAERARIDAHLATCAACRTTLEELRAVVGRASSLQDTAPERDLWTGVAARIGGTAATPGLTAGPTAAAGRFRTAIRKRVTFTLPQLAAAALALMVLSGGLVWRARSGDPRADFQPVSASDSSPSATVVADLEAETARVLDAHLRALDNAIAECTAALAENPGDAYLAVHLSRLKSLRVALLRDTADQNSAAR